MRPNPRRTLLVFLHFRCCSFTAEYSFYDEVRSEELKPGGKDIPVTNANRQASEGLRMQGLSCRPAAHLHWSAWDPWAAPGWRLRLR